MDLASRIVRWNRLHASTFAIFADRRLSSVECSSAGRENVGAREHWAVYVNETAAAAVWPRPRPTDRRQVKWSDGGRTSRRRTAGSVPCALHVDLCALIWVNEQDWSILRIVDADVRENTSILSHDTACTRCMVCRCGTDVLLELGLE